MKKIQYVLSTVMFSAAIVFSSSVHGKKDAHAWRAAVYPSKNIVENTAHLKDLTTLVAPVKAASLSTRWRDS